MKSAAKIEDASLQPNSVLLSTKIHSQAFENRGELAFGGVDELLAAEECGGAVLDFFAAEFVFFGHEHASAIGDRAAAVTDGGIELNGQLLEREECLIVVAGSERSVGDVFDELRAEFDVRADDVGTAAAEVLTVQPDH